MLHVYSFIRSSMSSSCAHRLLLTKEVLGNYKYTQIIMRYVLQIRDTVCDDIEKGNIQCYEKTKYAYKIDEQTPIYKSAIQIHSKEAILGDVTCHLQQLFPDSIITIQDKEILNGFVVTKNTYIEIDWS